MRISLILILAPLILGLGHGKENDDYYATNDDDYDYDPPVQDDPCARLYPTCRGCLQEDPLQAAETSSSSSTTEQEQCVFQIRDSEIKCVSRRDDQGALAAGINATENILIRVHDGGMCRYDECPTFERGFYSLY